MKDYITALNNPLITKSSKIGSCSSIEYDSNIIKVDSKKVRPMSSEIIGEQTKKRAPN
jgi:hypothetical protein